MNKPNSQYKYRLWLEKLRNDTTGQQNHFVNHLLQCQEIDKQKERNELVRYLKSYDFSDLKYQLMGLAKLLEGYKNLPASLQERSALENLQKTFRSLSHTLIYNPQRSLNRYDEFAAQLFARLDASESSIFQSIQNQANTSRGFQGELSLVSLHQTLKSQTSSPYQTLAGHQYPITAVASGLDGRTLVSGDISGFIRIWDIDNAENIELRCTSKAITSLVVSNRWLIAGSLDGNVYVWRNNGISYKHHQSPDYILDFVENAERAESRQQLDEGVVDYSTGALSRQEVTRMKYLVIPELRYKVMTVVLQEEDTVLVGCDDGFY
mgnify:CR=1 FL=1